jgi:hypothetical protein
MSYKQTGGPAFPHSFVAHPTEETFVAKGMTLRDYFAAKAMQGVLSAQTEILDGLLKHTGGSGSISELSYNLADAMLKAREDGNS